MKFHKWLERDDAALLLAIEEFQPIFDHYREQGKTYTEANAWDAVAGRLLPKICVTGAACRRRVEVLKESEQIKEDRWKSAMEKVNAYERDLAETTFDGVTEILASMDVLLEVVSGIHSEILSLKEMWE
jgi:hypothetical protein